MTFSSNHDTRVRCDFLRLPFAARPANMNLVCRIRHDSRRDQRRRYGRQRHREPVVLPVADAAVLLLPCALCRELLFFDHCVRCTDATRNKPY